MEERRVRNAEVEESTPCRPTWGRFSNLPVPFTVPSAGRPSPARPSRSSSRLHPARRSPARKRATHYLSRVPPIIENGRTGIRAFCSAASIEMAAQRLWMALFFQYPGRTSRHFLWTAGMPPISPSATTAFHHRLTMTAYWYPLAAAAVLQTNHLVNWLTRLKNGPGQSWGESSFKAQKAGPT